MSNSCNGRHEWFNDGDGADFCAQCNAKAPVEDEPEREDDYDYRQDYPGYEG